MNRKGAIALSLLVAGCATETVRTPEQAEHIALASVCAKRQIVLAANETMPAEWVAERRGDKWYAWLPFGPGAQYSGVTKYGHMGAWISAKDGKIVSCENGVSRAIGQAQDPAADENEFKLTGKIFLASFKTIAKGWPKD